MPESSARSSLHVGQLAAEDAAQDRVEEEHRLAAERPVRPAGLEEHHGRAGQAAQLDLAGDRLDDLLADLLRLGHPHAGSSASAAAGRHGRGALEDAGERVVGGGPAQGEDDQLRPTARRAGPPRTAATVVGRGLVERVPADASTQGREGDAGAPQAVGRGDGARGPPRRSRDRSCAGPDRARRRG